MTRQRIPFVSLVLSALFGCGSDQGAPSPAAAGDDADAALAPETAADDGGSPDLAAPDSAEVACEPVGSFVTFPTSCTPGVAAEAALASGTESVTALALEHGETVALAGWAIGSSAWVQRVGDDAQPAGEPLLLRDDPRATKRMEIVPMPGAFAVAWTEGEASTTTPGASIETWYAEVREDGSVQTAPKLLLATLELGRGAAHGAAGSRFWGFVDQEDLGEPVRTASMVRVADGGTVDGVHFMRNPANLSYLSVHASEGLLASVFAENADDQRVGYFLTDITANTCGLPVDTGITLGAGSELVRATFVGGLLVWVVRDPGECAGGRAVLYYLDALSKPALTLDLPFAPSAKAEVAIVSATEALVADVAGGDIHASTLGGGKKPHAGVEEALVDLPDGTDVARFRLVRAGDAWLVLSAGTTSGATVVRAHAACPKTLP